MWGGYGGDIMEGGDGNDTMYGDGCSGPDQMYGDAGDDKMYGQSDNDYLNGGSGNDYLNGGCGNDVLDGGNGEKQVVVILPDGKTIITGGGPDGDDTLIGGGGNDTYLYGTGGGHDTVENCNCCCDDDVVAFKDGVTADQLLFTKDGKDLDIYIAGSTGDELTVKNWYGCGTCDQVDRFTLSDGSQLYAKDVNALVQAMAGFDPASASTSDIASADGSYWSNSWTNGNRYAAGAAAIPTSELAEPTAA
jgi:hypothetical protein